MIVGYLLLVFGICVIWAGLWVFAGLVGLRGLLRSDAYWLFVVMMCLACWVVCYCLRVG